MFFLFQVYKPIKPYPLQLMMSLLTSNHCKVKVCQCLMFYFEVWYQSAQEVTVSLMSPKLIAAAKDSWACFDTP